MTFLPAGLRNAAPGQAWVLTHSLCHQHGLSTETTEYIGVYLDPRQAIHDLADRIRPHWQTQRRRPAGPYQPPLPALQPADDFAAVALFFADPGEENRPGFQTFALELHAIDTTPAPPGPEYVLVLPYGEYLCVCGNHAADAGFEACDVHGVLRPDGPDPDWDGHYLCSDCGRIIRPRTGLVVARR